MADRDDVMDVGAIEDDALNDEEGENSDEVEEGYKLCGNQNFTARSTFVLHRRVDLHAIDAMPARWRGGAGSSPLDGASTARPRHRREMT